MLFTKYYQVHQIRADDMGAAYSAHGDMENTYKMLVGKP
jgi:hypothetical protein